MSDRTARYVMIGGFLGAGKSTSILELAKHLDAKGLKVGLITNDQGTNLVDTLKLRSQGFAVEEIPGGCFCCRFNTLTEAAENLDAATRPDIFIAEPVGSCTDLIASVSYPLRRIYGDRFSIAPLSVVVDPLRCMRVLGIGNERGFSQKVTYIYLKQLEEAATIIINKADLITQDQETALRKALADKFPGKTILTVSARTGENLDHWFENLMSGEQPGGDTMDLDYKVYAEGEALLGWLNATVELKADQYIDGDQVLSTLAESVGTRLAVEDIEIAHFKMTLSPEDGSGELAVLNMVGTTRKAEFSQSLSDPLDSGQIIVNLRAEGDPQRLSIALQAALIESAAELSGVTLDLDHIESFKPGEPNPIYRMKHDQETLAGAL
ncbi:MAG: GTP-binding protein [Acidobacteriota bacterium]|nr:GTP-binding protein [Acidobacteriota bacterium]